jgi:hypothetical protein
VSNSDLRKERMEARELRPLEVRENVSECILGYLLPNFDLEKERVEARQLRPNLKPRENRF